MAPALNSYLKSKEESFEKQPNSEGRLPILFIDTLRSVRLFAKVLSLQGKENSVCNNTTHAIYYSSLPFSKKVAHDRNQTKAMTNYNRRRKSNKPITDARQIHHMQPAVSAGRRKRANQNWFGYCLWLDKNVARDFFSESQCISIRNKATTKITFETAIFTRPWKKNTKTERKQT